VAFREIKDVVKQEVLPSKEEPEKIEFEPKDDESNSTEDRCEKKSYQKGILHLIFVQIFLCLLLVMILELFMRQWIRGWKTMEKGHG
jgi:hypothetical protein